jgi:hypothetical protein
MERLPARLPPAPSFLSQTVWYVVRLKDFGFGGPLGVDGIKAAIDAGTLSWTDITYVEGPVAAWKRLFEVEAMQKFLPAVPEAERMKKFTDRVTAKLAPVAVESRSGSGWIELLSGASAKIPRVEWSSPRYWFFLINGREVGPVDIATVEQASRTAKIPESIFAWQVSMNRWKPLEEIPELSKYVGKAAAIGPDLSLVIERGAQKRSASRKSLVASVFQISPGGKSEMLGVCGDVSANGFQLIQYGRIVEYITGTRLELEIRASKMSKLTPFRVHATVKWFDPAQKSVGLEFMTIDPMDRKLLEKFTQALS